MPPVAVTRTSGAGVRKGAQPMRDTAARPAHRPFCPVATVAERSVPSPRDGLDLLRATTCVRGAPLSVGRTLANLFSKVRLPSRKHARDFRGAHPLNARPLSRSPGKTRTRLQPCRTDLRQLTDGVPCDRHGEARLADKESRQLMSIADLLPVSPDSVGLRIAYRAGRRACRPGLCLWWQYFRRRSCDTRPTVSSEQPRCVCERLS
jgi:hypothetical protein